MRDVRRSLCEQLAGGTATLEDVMGARSDPRVGDIHLHVLVESLPGASKVATRRKLAELHLAPRTRIEDLHDAEVSSVIAEFGGAPGVDLSGVSDP